ncbi:MAG TPA: aminotransferase class I/II-fold pyridoxal phosphate-dependent enzyme [Microlunatus sp.]|nr:aminotransferase class I/II-fold pyridoxal phosphate-dependent enzyme [Microlunatus sp.]
MNASRRSAVPPFAVMTVLQRVAELRAAGRDVISLCAGEPSEGAPSDVKRRLAELMVDRTPLGYSETFGLRALRTAIAGHYRRWYDLDVPVEQIAVTTGSSGAFLVSFLAAFDPGDRVLLARPGYPAYRNILSSLGCAVVELPCGPAERFQPTPALLEAALADGPVAGLVLASPANPTGTMVDRDQLAELTQWCREHQVRLVSDEIYHGIVDVSLARRVGPGCSAWQQDRTAVVVSSFSKYWGMTGWRLGWALVPEDLVDAVDALAGNYALCAPVPAQHAALEAFSERSYAEAEAAVREFAAARSLVLGAVDDLGWTKVAPADGAFYVWADIADRLGPHADSASWCAALLDAEGIAVTPGSDFDQVEGRTAIRLSLAAGPEAVGAALLRIRRFQQGLGRSEPTRSRSRAAAR